ncbi:MAG: L-alanine-DL-glutamate epimerase-like enolase superfamily enzyme [Saprospiraceae bacterium]|mgnify:CR=1 FL=1|jgi:L-alanine-DL-glutamate epimerase-like enolase superfamily enzyme
MSHIEKVSYIRLDLELNESYTIAYETVESAINYILKITTTNGISGYGCAAPDKHVTAEDPIAIETQIRDKVLPFLEGKNPYQRGELNEGIREMLPNHKSVQAMVDMALHDLVARRAKLPLYQVLGGYRDRIATSVTIGILPVSETIVEAKRILSNGFKILKIKGGLDIDSDIEKIKKLREQLGSFVRIRFDANQGYTPKETVKFIDAVSRCNLEIIEQPVHIDEDLSTYEFYTGSKVPIMADESLKGLRDAYKIAKNKTIDMINIKLQKVGGITQGAHINSVSKAAGNEVMIGCLDECALGIAAGLHFALSRPNIIYADLDAHLDFNNDPFSGLFQIKEGIMYPKMQPGLGVINSEIESMFED